MNAYLDQLRDEISKRRLPGELTKPPEPPFVGFDSAQSERVLKNRGSAVASTSPQAWAGGIAKLNPARPPATIPARYWRPVAEAAQCFIESPWAAQAHALGWTTVDLFGAHAKAPWERFDSMGLVWFLPARYIVAMTEHAAALKTRSGRELVFRIPRPATDGAPLWALS